MATVKRQRQRQQQGRFGEPRGKRQATPGLGNRRVSGALKHVWPTTARKHRCWRVKRRAAHGGRAKGGERRGETGGGRAEGRGDQGDRYSPWAKTMKFFEKTVLHAGKSMVKTLVSLVLQWQCSPSKKLLLQSII